MHPQNQFSRDFVLSRFRARFPDASVIEAEQHHIPILHYVLLALGAGDPLVAGALPAVRLDEVLEGDGLRLDEPLFEVGVDHAGGLGGAIPLVDGPSADLLLAGGEVALQAEEVVGGVGEAVEAALGEAEGVEELLAVGLGELGELHLHLGGESHDLGGLAVGGDGGLERLDHRVSPVDLALGDIRGVEHRLAGEEVEGAVGRGLLLGRRHEAGRLPVGEDRLELLQEPELDLGLGVAALGGAGHLVEALVDAGEVSEAELDVDDLAVAGGVGAPHHVLDVLVHEAADHVDDGVDLADVGEELVAEPFALGGALHQPGDVDELDRGGDRLLRIDDLGELGQARVRDGDDAGVRLDRGERVVRDQRAGLGEGVEEGRLPDVRETYDSEAQHLECFLQEELRMRNCRRGGTFLVSEGSHACRERSAVSAVPHALFSYLLNRFIAASIPSAIQTSTASAIESRRSPMRPRSSRVNGSRTKSAVSLVPGGRGPTPIRSRAYSCERSVPSMLLRPLWPPAEPPGRRRKRPASRWKSSTRTRSCLAGSNPGMERRGASAAPLRFMYVHGLKRRISSPCRRPAVLRAWVPRLKAPNPQRVARWSASQNPALWRVPSYSEPGFPSPTMARTGYFSSASASSSLPFLMTSGSAVVAASPAGAATSSTRGATTAATTRFPSSMISAFGIESSETWIDLPMTRLVTSTSKCSGMSAGRTLTVSSRSGCSRMPPPFRTPSAVPVRCTGTLTVIFSLAFTSYRSRWTTSCHRTGSRWISRISALTGALPSTAMSSSARMPCSTVSRRLSAFASTVREAASRW